MRWRLFLGGFLRALFILYCVEAGIFLTILPWREAWDRLLLDLPYPMLHDLLVRPLMRGVVSGFGLVHLVWGAHDLEDLFLRRRFRDRRSVSSAQHP
jgi:hypothetical protein